MGSVGQHLYMWNMLCHHQGGTIPLPNIEKKDEPLFSTWTLVFVCMWTTVIIWGWLVLTQRDCTGVTMSVCYCIVLCCFMHFALAVILACAECCLVIFLYLMRAGCSWGGFGHWCICVRGSNWSLLVGRDWRSIKFCDWMKHIESMSFSCSVYCTEHSSLARTGSFNLTVPFMTS